MLGKDLTEEGYYWFLGIDADSWVIVRFVRWASINRGSVYFIADDQEYDPIYMRGMFRGPIRFHEEDWG